MPADTLTLPQDPLTQDKPIRAIPQDVPNLSWGGKYQSFHWWKLQDVKLWMLSCHIEKVVGKYEADRLKEADERWRALVGLSSRLQGFRGHPGPARPSLPLTCKIPPPHTHTPPRVLPDEFPYVCTSPDWISVTCNQNSCLINESSLLALSSFVNYLFTVLCSFFYWMSPLSD